MRNVVFTLLYVLALLCAADRAESSQAKLGAIDIHVVSKQGAAIDDAKISVRQTTSGYSDYCRTDKNGNCRLENSPNGTYEVTVKASGFEVFKLSDVKVNLESVLNLPVTLEPAPPPASIAGYIDNAIIGSQIRIRSDAAFHMNAPDRAEFFYARYSGLNNGPGPQSVVANLNFQQLYLRAEYAPIKRFSFFAEVPVRWIQPQQTVANAFKMTPPFVNMNSAGLSDLAAGFKLAAVASSNQYLTLQLQAHFPSGKASTGLGTNHYSVEPALLYFRRISDRAALEVQVGDSHPIGGSFCPQQCVADPPGAPPFAAGGFAGDVFSYGVGPSYILYRGEHVRITPVIELVGWRVLGGLQTNCVPVIQNTCGDQEGASANGTSIVNLKVGARTSIGSHNSFYVGFGHVVTHSRWYQEIVRAEYRYSF
jgi:carboxypeptidase family protein